MLTVIAIAAPLAVIGVLDAAASRWGQDSRPGFDERRPFA